MSSQLNYSSSPALTNTSQQSCSCRDKYKHSRYLWPAKGIYLQWVQPKKRWTIGMKSLTSSQEWSILTKVQQSIVHPTNLFQFQKQVRFRDRSDRPDLEFGCCRFRCTTTKSPAAVFINTILHESSQVPLNCTFDVSGIPPTNIGIAQDTPTIVAEVSAAVAAAAQASKEFWRMQEPKITKLHGGYSADAELIFQVLVSGHSSKYTRTDSSG